MSKRLTKIVVIITHGIILIVARNGVGPIIFIDFGFLYLIFKESLELAAFPLTSIAILSILGKLLMLTSFFGLKRKIKTSFTLISVLFLLIAFVLLLVYMEDKSLMAYPLLSSIPFVLTSTYLVWEVLKR